MAGDTGNPAGALALLDALAREPWKLDFFQALRRLEVASRKPRALALGKAPRPADEPVRLGQQPSMAFAPAALAALHTSGSGPPRLAVSFLGLLGPNGPLPLHLSEFAHERLLHNRDPTFVRFLDLFHHRMLAMFYRAWADAQPTVALDRPNEDTFAKFVGALVGLAPAALRDRDRVPDRFRFFFAGRFGMQARSSEGLEAVIAGYFRWPVRIESFVGQWLDLPDECRWRLGPGPDGAQLGLSTTLGARAWSCQQKFRVVLGPLGRAEYQRMLPGGDALARLAALVRAYAGDELAWDARLVLATPEPMRLGAFSRLGIDCWLAGDPAGQGREDLIVDPRSGPPAAGQGPRAAA